MMARLAMTAVADLAALGAADATGLADRIRRKVVVQHERVFVIAAQRIDEAARPRRSRGHDHALGLAAGEQLPWVRGSTPVRMVIGRTVRVSRPSMRGLPDKMRSRTVRYWRSPTKLEHLLLRGFGAAFGGELADRGVAQLGHLVLAGSLLGDTVGIADGSWP